MEKILLCSLALGMACSAAEQPNILLLFADDLGRYASAYADPEIPSPNDIIETEVFERIAKEGALFRNAFVSVPSCTPSRAALNTGRHFFRNGSHAQLHHLWQEGAPDPFAEIKGMPVTLQDGGYHIGLTYKLHMSSSIIGGSQNLYNRSGSKFNNFSKIVSKSKDPEETREMLYKEVRGNFADFISKREKGQPFFYSFNPTNTHRTWALGSGKKLWGLEPDDLKGKMPSVLPDVPPLREDMADYLGETLAFDKACGELIKMVEDMGELENTIVIISGDHGAPGFPRGKCNVHDFGSRVLLAIRWPEKITAGRDVEVPVSLIDLAPTLLAAAGLESHDDPNGENLLPALTSEGNDSKLRGWALIGREVHVSREPAREGRLPYPVRALRTPKFLYIKNFKPDRWPMGAPFNVTEDSQPTYKELVTNTYSAFPDMDASPAKAWMVEHRKDEGMEPFLDFAWGKRPVEELYEISSDPWQAKNLAEDPAYAKTLKELREKLMAELGKNNDPRLDNDAFDRLPYLHTPQSVRSN